MVGWGETTVGLRWGADITEQTKDGCNYEAFVCVCVCAGLGVCVCLCVCASKHTLFLSIKTPTTENIHQWNSCRHGCHCSSQELLLPLTDKRATPSQKDENLQDNFIQEGVGRERGRGGRREGECFIFCFLHPWAFEMRFPKHIPVKECPSLPVLKCEFVILPAETDIPTRWPTHIAYTQNTIVCLCVVLTCTSIATYTHTHTHSWQRHIDWVGI